jgi:phosphoribosyl-AMP cyclohydrolase
MRPLASIDDVSFDANGWIPAIAQDAATKRVLMLGYMTADTLRETLDIGRMVYWSRSRGERWAKGDSSGDVQFVRQAFYDCEGRSLLFVVEQQGKGACHTGEFSCYFRDLRDLASA